MDDRLTSKSLLLELPSEILLNICEVVLPDDIVNFVLACRQLFSFAGRVLEEHRRFRCHTHLSLVGGRASEIFLNYCAPNSRIFLYPKEFSIMAVSAWSVSNKDDQAALKQVRSMATEKGGFFPCRRIISLLDTLDSEQLNGAMTAIVARCLPNLETVFHMHNAFKSPSSEIFIDALVNGITELNINPQAFSRLSRFSTITPETTLYCTDLEPFLPLLALPNLKSFQASWYNCTSFNSLPFPPRTSKLEILDIYLKGYSWNSISTLFSAFNALKCLSFSVFDQGLPAVQGIFPAIYDALLEHSRDSLRHLEFHERNKNRVCFGFLRPFSVLKSVILGPELLFMDGDVMYRLVDMFPCSIQEIVFYGYGKEIQEKQFFAGFLRERDAKVPNLRAVVNCIRPDTQYREDLQQEGDYSFKYLKYRKDIVMIQVIDATGRWKLIKPSSKILKKKGISSLQNGDD